MSSPPGRANIERPTGRPSTSASGMLTCGAPSVPEMVVSVLIAVRCPHMAERGWPRSGAGNGAVGSKRIRLLVEHGHEFGPARRPEFARCRKHRVRRLSAAHEIVGDVEREARIMPIDPLAERIPGLAPLDGALMRKPAGERHRDRDPTVLAADRGS